MAPPNPSTSPQTTESVHSFVPRPFPPPSLVGVPHEYIIDSLRKLAPQYWNNAESSDCSISKLASWLQGSTATADRLLKVYPLDNRPSGLTSATAAHDSGPSSVPRTELLSSSHDPSGMGRRLTAPSLNREEARVLMKVCILLRAFADGTALSHPMSQKSSISTTSPRNRLSSAPSSADHPRLI